MKATNLRNDYDAEYYTQADHAGRTYHSTGKTGRNIKTGTAVGEMESDDYHRIWIDAEGNVYPD